MEILTHGHTTLAGKAVAKALKQIDEAEKGNFAAGSLNETELKGILAVRRGEAK